MPLSAHEFERRLIFYASPTLTKLKVACMYNLNDLDDLEECIDYYNEILNKKDIYLKVLSIKGRSMIYVYQKEKLNNLFNNHKFRAVLNNYHYPYQDIDSLINWLKIRMNSSEFPHEIGLFLGYPLTDVKGFINGADYKYIGYWKVYSHVPQTLCTFDRYKKCTQELKRRFCQGERIEQLLAHV